MPKSKPNTKERILSCALDMFNETSTQTATTNHIAAALGMSIGNLHYHFKNREAIILELYRAMLKETKIEKSAYPQTIVELLEHQEYLIEVFWKYRFFQRELSMLLFRDELFKAEYIAENLAHRERIITILKHLRDAGEMQIAYDNVFEHLADTILLVTQYYVSFSETLNKTIDYSCIELSMVHVREAMRPYIPKGHL